MTATPRTATEQVEDCAAQLAGLQAEYEGLQDFCVRLLCGTITPNLTLAKSCDGQQRPWEICHDDGEFLVPILTGLSKAEANRRLKAMLKGA